MIVPNRPGDNLITILRLLCAVLMVTMSVAMASAQNGARGTVNGTVSDSDGAPIEKAQVSLINAQQAVLGKNETDSAGRFTFTKVPAGSYELKIVKAEFSAERVPVQITGAPGADVTVKLTVTDIAEEVTITAESGQVQDPDRIPQQVNVIEDDAIRQRVTSVLAQVADEEEGIQLQQTSPTIASIYVRGLTGRYVSVYVDGVRYTNGAQRGGINTFFNLNEPSGLRAVEVLRGPNSAQYGSGALGGTLQLISRVPGFGGNEPEFHGEFNTVFSSADLSYGGNSLLTYGTNRIGLLFNLASRRVNTLRTGRGIDSHAAVTRFLGLRSDIFGERLTDTAFTQYGGTAHVAYAPSVGNQIIFHYKRGQQDGGKRYDQTLGGDGNLIADLRNLMLDFAYARYNRQGAGFFDNASFTFSFNSQREERVNQGGQGNPLASITSQFERTNSYGFSFQLDKQATSKYNFLVGADIYRDKVDAPAFTLSPVSGTAVPSRPRVPDDAKFLTYGFFVQNVYDLMPGKVRLSGALRYAITSYKARAADSPIVRGRPLFPDDSARVDDFTGRVGIVVSPWPGFDAVFNYSRGFNAPNITELGTLGLTGDGFEVATLEAAALGGTIGNMAGDRAITTGKPVSRISSEFSNNFDVGLRYRNSRIDTELTGFIIDINDPIIKQSLILPQGAVGKFLGDQPIVRQLPNGVVFVPLSASPVLIRTNFGDARTFGFEYTLNYKLTDELSFRGNFTYLRSKDKATGAPPNIEGGTPAPNAFLSLRYAPRGKRFWVEAYGTLVDRTERLSSLDLADRRIGAPRSRSNIAAFFNNGARVRGLIGRGNDGIAGTSDDILLPTGETLAQVQNRLLGSAMSAPLFPELPGYGLVNLRGGFNINEKTEMLIDFENIADKSYRGISWGIDGPGRSVTVRLRYQF